jgi:hypothetical protein
MWRISPFPLPLSEDQYVPLCPKRFLPPPPFFSHHSSSSTLQLVREEYINPPHLPHPPRANAHFATVTS